MEEGTCILTAAVDVGGNGFSTSGIAELQLEEAFVPAGIDVYKSHEPVFLILSLSVGTDQSYFETGNDLGIGFLR